MTSLKVKLQPNRDRLSRVGVSLSPISHSYSEAYYTHSAHTSFDLLIYTNLQFNQTDGSVPTQPREGLLPGCHSSPDLGQLLLNSHPPSLPCARTHWTVTVALLERVLAPKARLAAQAPAGNGEKCGV